LKQQDTKIQKVTAQLEMNKFARGRICRGGPAQQMALKSP
jgi:hypothetical protein